MAKSNTKTKTLPKRKHVPLADQWDLTKLYTSDAAWEKDFKKWESQIPNYKKFKGKLAKSPKILVELLQFDSEFERIGERLGNYASLKAAGDNGDSTYQRMKGRFHHVAVKASEGASYIRPELLAIPKPTMDKFLQSPELSEWKLALERILRYRPHTLTPHEEQLLVGGEGVGAVAE